MKMDELAALMPNGPVTASPEVFQQLGAITRMLHDTLQQLGVMPKLQQAADGLPDARSRLNYIANKTAAAAEKVLDSVDQAKQEHQGIAAETRKLGAALIADPVRAVASGAVLNFVGDVEARTRRIDQHLTDIMLAQDFHECGVGTSAEQAHRRVAASHRKRESIRHQCDGKCCILPARERPLPAPGEGHPVGQRRQVMDWPDVGHTAAARAQQVPQQVQVVRDKDEAGCTQSLARKPGKQCGA